MQTISPQDIERAKAELARMAREAAAAVGAPAGSIVTISAGNDTVEFPV